MKNSILTLGIIIAFATSFTLFTGCGTGKQKSNEATEHQDLDDKNHQDIAASVFACPMHAEITGKEGDTCSKCGMVLVALISDQVYNCPMHPEITGKEGDKC